MPSGADRSLPSRKDSHISKNACRTIIASVLAGATLFGTAGAACAAKRSVVPRNDDVAVVDEPDTGGLNDKWTFAPLGVPVFGVIDSLTGVPDRILPGS